MTAVLMLAPTFDWLWPLTALTVVAMGLGPFLSWQLPMLIQSPRVRRFGLAFLIASVLAIPAYAAGVCCYECDWYYLIFWMCFAA